MLSVVKIQCPHCGAHGQLLLPQVLSIVVGSCPECEGASVVFNGHILPLEKDIMENGSIEDVREHLMDTLTISLEDQVTDVLDQAADRAQKAARAADSNEPEKPAVSEKQAKKPHKFRQDHISEYECEVFMGKELVLLDNANYFHAVFG